MIRIFEIEDFGTFDFDEIIQSINRYRAVVITIKTSFEYMKSAWTQYLNPDQVIIMNKYQKKNDRINYAITKSVINLIFSKMEHINWSEVIWSYGKYKKPYVKNSFDLNFSISHTCGCSMVALSKNIIGVDVENLERDIDYHGIMLYFFSNNEKKEVLTLEDFYKYWICKEAYLKYKGIGLIQELSLIEIVNIDNNKVVIVDKDEGIKKEVLLFKEGKYMFAICY